MILLANFLSAIAFVLDMVFQTLLLFVLVSALLSWVNPDPFNPIVRFLRSMTDPLLRPIRRFVPPLGGRVDISPLVLILVIYFLQVFLVGSLSSYALQIKYQALGGALPMSLQ